jgi:hypothetical protein
MTTPPSQPPVTAYFPHHHRSIKSKLSKRKRTNNKPYSTPQKPPRRIIRVPDNDDDEVSPPLPVSVVSTTTKRSASRPSPPGAPFPQSLIYVTLYASDNESALVGALCKQTPYESGGFIHMSDAVLQHKIQQLYQMTGHYLKDATSVDDLLAFYRTWQAQAQAQAAAAAVVTSRPLPPLPQASAKAAVVVETKRPETVSVIDVEMTAEEEEEEEKAGQDCSFRRAEKRSRQMGGFVGPDYFFPSRSGGAPVYVRPENRRVRRSEPMADLIPSTPSSYDRVILDSVEDPLSVSCNCTVMRSSMPPGWRCDDCRKWSAIYNPIQPARPPLPPPPLVPRKITVEEMASMPMMCSLFLPRLDDPETCRLCENKHVHY